MFGKVISGSLLICGTTIGAGMLGIPLVTAAAGFYPGLLATCLVWLFMLATGFLFLEATLWMKEGSNILSMSYRLLGSRGRALAGVFFVFLYYSLMIAYFAAGAPLLGAALSALLGVTLPPLLMSVVFGLIFGLVVAISPKSIDRTNVILSVAMVATWLGLIGIGSEQVEFVRLEKSHWGAFSFAFPILFGAFGFHNVIPSLCFYLKKDIKILRLCMFIGTVIPLIVYIVWQWLIIGSIPSESLAQTLKKGLPVTQALHAVTGYSSVLWFGNAFAFFAIVTSILGVSFSMVDFLGDGLKIQKRSGLNRVILTLMTYIPPFFFAAINPHIFDTALGIAGGFGEALLNGLLPVALVWAGRYKMNLGGKPLLKGGRLMLVVLGAISLVVMGLEASALWFA